MKKYPLSMIVFHTLIAVFMIGALLIGWNLEENRDLMMLHKSFGVAVLLLAVVRIINRFRVAKSVPESVNPKGLKRIVEKSVHGLLYIVMLGIPLCGWLLSNASGYPASFFGLFSLPTLMAKNPDMAHTLGEFHELGANVFFMLLILHILGGVVHLVKEKQNVFKRMSPF